MVHLFAGRHGSCVWTVTPFRTEAGNPLIKGAGLLQEYDPGSGLSLERAMEKVDKVDFLICQGNPPSRFDVLLERARIVVWFQQRSTRKTSGGKRALNGVPYHSVFTLYHAYLGGVTNFGTRIHVASNDKELEWPESLRDWIQSGIPSNLGSCVSPVHGVGRYTDEPTDEGGASNSAKGLLEWDKRFGRVLVPTVYNKHKWGWRRLVPKELCAVLDLPLDRTKLMSERYQILASNSPVPGKIYAEAIRLMHAILESQPPERDTEVGEEVDEEREAKRPKLVSIEFDPNLLRDESSHIRSGEDGSISLDSSLLEQPPLDEDDATVRCSNVTPAGPAKGATVSGKAAKSDDAAIPTYLWDERVRPHVNPRSSEAAFQRALRLMRQTMLARWIRNVEEGFEAWLKARKTEGRKIDPRVLSVGRRAIRYARRATWWTWEGGSALFFWRWPWQENYFSDYVFGPPVRFIADPPNDMRPQPPYTDEEVRRKVRKKVQAVIDKGYIEITPKSEIRSCMYMFDVPKGESDIRMVYDGSRSGLNGSLEALWFTLPTIESLARSMEEGTWCADNDYGEMFLNFPLHPDLQKYCGVDLSQLFPEEAAKNGGQYFGRWTRLAMGLRPSPQGATASSLRAKAFLLGDRNDLENPFHWATVKLNLPGSATYNPAHPWVAKFRADGRLAADAEDYIDDIRFNAPDEDLAWRASSQWAKRCAWLGLQDAARKRREPSQTPGAWAGSVIGSDRNGLYRSVLPERWAKTQKGVRWFGRYLKLTDSISEAFSLADEAWFVRDGECPEGHLPLKQAERIRGFLIYVSRTYPSMVPYLKGIHLTLDSWRPHRDAEGWRIAENARPKDLGLDQIHPTEAPKYVRAVRRLRSDIKALMALTSAPDPPRPPVRAKAMAAMYIVGDASGSGFGTSRWSQGEEIIHVDHGVWTSEGSNNSSNYREAANFVLRLEELSRENKIPEGTELFIFTDNFVTENAFFKGSSKSRTLHDLVLRLRKLEMAGKLFINCVWIPGTRMIAQGTDGLSRGDFTSGVMTGQDFLSFLPISQNAFERQPGLRNHLQELSPVGLTFLTVEGWFDGLAGDPLGAYVWCPAPCIADVALETMCRMKQAHPQSTHLFVCPEIMTYKWRKRLLKISDVLLKVPLGSYLWDATQFEILYIGLTFPILSRSPWVWKRSNEARKFEKTVPELWGRHPSSIRDHLRELWKSAIRENV